MSSCGYYTCHKGKVWCKHPTLGEYKTKLLEEGGSIYHPCDRCRKVCGGIYPSQLPKMDISNSKIDILDVNGNVIG